jgi:aspartokinase-like uncharacterized kinase
MWVLKLGGSLYHGTALARWVDAIASCDDPPVVVPGGGLFADQVRDAQQRWRFPDSHAHAMALLAMEQMGLLLCGLNPRLIACADSASIQAARARGNTAVWMPSRTVLADKSINEDWTITSDSLALWLASELDVAGVVLVKSADLPETEAPIATMQGLGVLDEAFARFESHLSCTVKLVHSAYDGALEQLLLGQAGCRLTRA